MQLSSSQRANTRLAAGLHAAGIAMREMARSPDARSLGFTA